MDTAIEREKNMKEWERAGKIKLIEKDNPNWNDLYDSIL
jgi:putative endonuclease